MTDKSPIINIDLKDNPELQALVQELFVNRKALKDRLPPETVKDVELIMLDEVWEYLDEIADDEHITVAEAIERIVWLHKYNEEKKNDRGRTEKAP